MALTGNQKALMYALGGVARGGATRGGYVGGTPFITIDGVHVGGGRTGAAGVIIESLTITDVLDETPNTCAFRVNAAIVTTGAEIVITLGSKNRIARAFAGYVLTTRQIYAKKPANVQTEVQAVDYSWLLGFPIVTRLYFNQSASAIVADLIALFAAANGFTTKNVAPGLPVVDTITFTEEELPNALTRLARRVGAYWYVDYQKDIHFFQNAEPTVAAPIPLTPSHPSLSNFQLTNRRTQAVTRVSVEGRGTKLLAPVAAGETRIPIESIDAFPVVAGVYAKIAFSGSVGGAMFINYSGTQPGGGGTLIGPGATPGTGPALGLLGGGGGAVDVGGHYYALSWATAAGETKVSPATLVTIPSPLATPTEAPTATAISGSKVNLQTLPGWRTGDRLEFAYCYGYGTPYGPGDNFNVTPPSPPVQVFAESWTGGTYAKGYEIKCRYSPNPACTRIFVLHRVAGSDWYCWDAGIGIPNVPGDTGKAVQTCVYPETYCTVAAEAAQAPSLRRVVVDGLATGPATVTARKLYRTKAGQGALLLVATIANNTATQYIDAAADTTLGAAAPVADTSGLQQPTGTINAGATAIIVASTGPFSATGGWATIAGEQAVRYTGFSAGALTGIPATGPGSLTGPVPYNTPIGASPLLTGIPGLGQARSILRTLEADAEVYTVVQVDDTAAQAELAALLHVADGKRSTWIQDRRLSIPEAQARGLAMLAARPLQEQSVAYTCRDTGTASGKTIAVNLPAPTNVAGSFKIQHVTISNFRPYNQPPTYTVEASGNFYTFEDLIRRMRVSV